MKDVFRFLRQSLTVALMITMVIMAACDKGDVAENGYKTLESAKSFYTAAGQVSVKLQQEGTITLEQYGKLRDLAEKFKAGYMVATAALDEYLQVTETTADTAVTANKKSEVLLAIKALLGMAGEITAAVQEFTGGKVSIPVTFVDYVSAILK